MNTASRLEALCKPQACQLVVLQDAADRAGVDLSQYPLQRLEIGGREGALVAHTVARAEDLPGAA